MNGFVEQMLTEDEYVAAVLKAFPDATEANVRRYRSYFNNRHKSMGFRDRSEMPVAVGSPIAPPKFQGVLRMVAEFE